MAERKLAQAGTTWATSVAYMAAVTFCCLLLGLAFGASCLGADSTTEGCRQNYTYSQSNADSAYKPRVFQHVAPEKVPGAGKFAAILKGFLHILQ